jgi:hypothetical protein
MLLDRTNEQLRTAFLGSEQISNNNLKKYSCKGTGIFFWCVWGALDQTQGPIHAKQHSPLSNNPSPGARI